MNKEKLYEAIGDINENHVRDAHATVKAKKPVWAKWGAIAACLCFVMVGIIGMQTGWFGGKSETVTLSNGESITFYKANTVGASIDLNVEARTITEEELTEVFGTLPIADANAYFTLDENKFAGLEGKYEGMKLVISAQGVQLLDAVVAGIEYPSMVNDVPITAGYFVTNANSQGVKTVIYFAYVELDGCTVYIENAGTEAEGKNVKEAVALAVEQFTETPIDLSAIKN